MVRFGYGMKHPVASSTTPVMEMLEDYIISMKSNAKDDVFNYN
jgi:hypothetical protein